MPIMVTLLLAAELLFLAACSDPATGPGRIEPLLGEWSAPVAVGDGGGQLSVGDRLYLVSSRGGGLHLQTSADEGSTWSGPVPIAPTGSLILYRGFAAQGQNLYLLTHSGDGTDIRFWRSSDGGLSWSAPVNLSAGNPLLLSHRVSLAVDGPTVHVTNSRQFNAPNRVVAYWRSTDGGVSFAPPTLLDTEATGGAVNPDIAARDGIVHLTYEVWNSGGFARQTVYRRSTDGGAVWAPRMILTASGQLRPRLIVRADKVAVVVEQAAERPDQQVEIRQSEDRGSSWSAPRTVSGLGGRFGHPLAAAGPGISLHVVGFQSDVAAGPALSYHSVDGGITWTGPKTANPFANAPLSMVATGTYVHLLTQPAFEPAGTVYYTRLRMD